MKNIKTLLRLSVSKCRTGLLVVAGVNLAMFSSCTEENMDGVADDNGVIRFELTANSGDGDSPKSRAACAVESPVLLYAHNSDTLYLHTTVTDYSPLPAESPMTRGIPATTDNFKSAYGAFGVKAYMEGTTTLYMDDKVSTESGGVWSPDGNERFWPGKQTLDFYACAPYEYNGKKPLDNEEVSYGNKKISFSYTIPKTTNGNDAKSQPDLMFAFASHSVETSNSGRVLLNFEHALAAIKFEALDIVGGTVNSISIKGVRGAGSCIYDASKDTGKFVWTPTGYRTSFSQNFNKQLNDQQTGKQEITGDDSETTFIMVPQALDEESVIEIVMKTKDGITHTLTAPLKGHKWEAGKIYTYTISTESINWTYVFDVTPNLTLPLGTTSGQYDVKSYRYRTQNPDIMEPVAWTAELQGNTYKNEITSFTYQGYGTTNTAGEQYKCSLTLPSMETSYDGDKKLSDATTKGTPANPYDLSTENGEQAQTTANCYVVSAAGTYSLPLVYGNAIKNNKYNTAAYSGSNKFYDYNNKEINSPNITGASDCVLVWSDAFYLFKDVRLSGNNLVFTLDQKYMQQANAIVAVRDKDRKIMWSWHIWVTEKDLSNTVGLQDYASGTNDKYQLMTCNLGWIDGKTITYQERELPFTFTQERSGKNQSLNIVQEGAKLDYKDGGSTYYQWGRKDPIVALKNRNATGAEDYRPHETGQDNYKYTCVIGKATLGDAIQNPNVFYIDNTGKYNWLSTFTKANGEVFYLWNSSATLKQSVDVETSTKTIYDPSPREFKVPMPRAFSVFVNGWKDSNYGGTLNGNIIDDHTYMVFSKKNKTGTAVTLTATGQRVDRKNGIDNVAYGGLWAMDGVYYWTCHGSANDKHYTGSSLCIRYIKSVSATNSNWFTYGFSGAQTMARPVRCIKE